MIILSLSERLERQEREFKEIKVELKSIKGEMEKETTEKKPEALVSRMTKLEEAVLRLAEVIDSQILPNDTTIAEIIKDFKPNK